MKIRTVSNCLSGRNALVKQGTRFCLLLLCCLVIELVGCKGKTTTPTIPETETPVPFPSPTAVATPDAEATPTPTPTPAEGSCDRYGENAEDPLKALEPDGEPYTVVMDCTGDIDWYKLELSSLPVSLEIVLTDIPDKSDFDIIAYDFRLNEMEDGRSAQSGNVAEYLSLTEEQDSVLYLKIYSYSGRGAATLTITGSELEDEPGNGTDDPDLNQLTYEEVLSEELPFYPRGSRTGLLEQSTETLRTEAISCQMAETELTGELSIGHYAHVERELIESIDYIDGWAVVVFNGSQELLNILTVTMRVTIFAPSLDLEVTIPSDMETQGNDYLLSKTREDVYYISQSYGDFLGNSSNDIQVFSGVVGNLGDLFADEIFTQQVEVEWRFEDENGSSCSGQATGKPIIDFEIRKYFYRFSDTGMNH